MSGHHPVMADRTLTDFLGTWRITRQVRPLTIGVHADGEGKVTITSDGHGARYVENLTLRLENGQSVQATRTYLWRPTPTGMSVQFEDGRPFHEFDPGKTAHSAEHWCDPDQYAVRYDFSTWPVWRMTWRVLGPRKDYELETSFRR